MVNTIENGINSEASTKNKVVEWPNNRGIGWVLGTDQVGRTEKINCGLGVLGMSNASDIDLRVDIYVEGQWDGKRQPTKKELLTFVEVAKRDLPDEFGHLERLKAVTTTILQNQIAELEQQTPRPVQQIAELERLIEEINS